MGDPITDPIMRHDPIIKKSISKPLMFREHKEKLSKMVADEARKSVKIVPKK